MTHNVILTYHDGTQTMHTFSTRFLADLFVASIPDMQRAGEMLDVWRAVIQPGVSYAN